MAIPGPDPITKREGRRVSIFGAGRTQTETHAAISDNISLLVAGQIPHKHSTSAAGAASVGNTNSRAGESKDSTVPTGPVDVYLDDILLHRVMVIISPGAGQVLWGRNSDDMTAISICSTGYRALC